MKLSELAPPRGARAKKVRVGRGEGCGLGKTSGRGGKGQTARTGGKVRAGFEGGQMPLYRRLPKLGFKSRRKGFGLNRYTTINLGSLETFADGETVNSESLASKGLRLKSQNQAGIKVLAGGKLSKKLNVEVHAISEAAKQQIEKLGGKVTLVSALRKTGVTDAQSADQANS